MIGEYAKIVQMFGVMSALLATSFSIFLVIKNRRIKTLHKSLDKLLHQQSMVASTVSSYTTQNVNRRMSLLVANIFVLSQKADDVKELRTQTFSQTYALARQWSTLMAESDAKKYSEEIDSKIKQIVSDNNLQLSEKIGKAEDLLQSEINKAGARVNQINEKISSLEDVISDRENNVIYLEQFLLASQFITLILLSAPDLLAKMALWVFNLGH